MTKASRYLTLLLVVVFLLSASVSGAEDGHESHPPTRLRRSYQEDQVGDKNVPGGKLGRNRRLHHQQQQQQQEQKEEEIPDDIQSRQEDIGVSTSMSTSMSTSLSMSLSMSMDMSTSQPSDGRTDVGDADDSTPTCPEDFTVLPTMPCGTSYPVGTVCDYNFQYEGCTWAELQCSWINQCECMADSGLVLGGGSSDRETARPVPPLWFCVSFARLRCPEDTTPLDLPRGPCDPDQPIPVPP